MALRTEVLAVGRLELSEVLDSLLRDRTLAAPELRGMLAFDLGELEGAALTFSDASPLGGELLVFTASAEDSPSTYEDGAILGSVVGTIARQGDPLPQTALAAEVQDMLGRFTRDAAVARFGPADCCFSACTVASSR